MTKNILAIAVIALCMLYADCYARGGFSSSGGRGGFSSGGYSSRSYSSPSRSYSSTTVTRRYYGGGGYYGGAYHHYYGMGSYWGGAYWNPFMFGPFGMGYGYSNGIIDGIIIGSLMHPAGTTVYTGGGYNGNALLYPDGQVVNQQGYQVGTYQNGQFVPMQSGQMIAQQAPAQYNGPALQGQAIPVQTVSSPEDIAATFGCIVIIIVLVMIILVAVGTFL